MIYDNMRVYCNLMAPIYIKLHVCESVSHACPSHGHGGHGGLGGHCGHGGLVGHDANGGHGGHGQHWGHG